MRTFLSILFSSLLVAALSAQTIWPGDVNNNGIVNGVDLLYWGIANGSSGPARSATSTNWAAQAAPADWSQSFPGGLNYAYADCDGNGLVDEDDFDNAIEDNFSLTQGAVMPDGYANAASGSSAPLLRLIPNMEIVGEGAVVTIDLVIDNNQQPLADFYGMALQLSYTTGLLEGGDGPDFDLTEDQWLDGEDGAVQELYIDNGGSGQAQLAVTRTNQMPVTPQTTAIGQFSIVIEDIIVGLTIDTFELIIDSVLISNQQLQAIATVPDTARIIIAKDPSVLLSGTSDTPAEVQNNSFIQLYPNPAAQHFFLETELMISQVRLLDQLGRTYRLPHQQLEPGLYRLQPPGLPPGSYYLQLQTASGIINRKIMLSPP